MTDQFSKDICRAAGHDWFKDPNRFADICRRCEEEVSWMNPSGVKKIATAMAAPLKANLDYSSKNKIVKVEKLNEDVCRVVGHDFKRLDMLVVKCKRCDHCTQRREY